MDSMHPKWQYVNEQKTIGDLHEVATFPAGTTFIVDKVIQYTNGVSGSSYPTVFGKIVITGKEYKVGYQWGERSMQKSYDKIAKCWQFHQAPWQDKRDTAFYALPTANFW